MADKWTVKVFRGSEIHASLDISEYEMRTINGLTTITATGIRPESGPIKFFLDGKELEFRLKNINEKKRELRG